MATLSDMLTAQKLGAEIQSQNDAQAKVLLESVSPYIDVLSIKDNDKFAQISDVKFDQLFEEKNGIQKIVDIINSSPTATTYTDINTGKKEKGTLVGLREGPAGITFEIQGKQGIVPKTMGFTNDPEDVVMATNREGLRTMVNTILQSKADRLTAGKKGFGSRVQAIATLDGISKNNQLSVSEQLDQAGSAPEAVAIIESLVETGELEPPTAFQMIVDLGTEFNDGLDAYRAKLGQDLTEVDSELETLRKAQKQSETADDFSRFGSPLGVGGAAQGTKFSSSGSRSKEKSPELLDAEKRKQDLLTRIGESNISMPLQASPEQLFAFIEANSNLLQEVGVEQATVDKTRAAFRKYNIQNPQDLKTLPEYDDEIDINKAEIAAALAVAAGGDFQKEFQESLNLLETGSVDVSRLQEQTFNRTSQKFNEELKLAQQTNRVEVAKLTTQAQKDAFTAFDKDFTNFVGALYDNGQVTDITANEGNIHFKRMIDKFSAAQRNGLATPLMVDTMRTAIGQSLYSVMMNRGVDDRNIFMKIFTDRANQDQTLGDIINTARGIYEERPGGGLQLKKIIFVDSTERQVGNAIEGKEFTDTFNDLATNIEVSQFIKPYRGD